MKAFIPSPSSRSLPDRLACVGMILFALAAHGQDVTPPECTGVTPASNAFGVPVDTPVVFTFSEPMKTDPGLISVMFSKFTPPFTIEDLTNFTPTWSADGLKLTCTFTPSLPASSFIVWTLGDTYEDLAGNPIDLSMNGDGAFQTGTGSGGGGGSGTNAFTSCFMLRQVDYLQTSTGSLQISPEDPFAFSAGTILASNRTASTISLTAPSGTVPLSPNPVAPEHWFFVAITNNQTVFDSLAPIAGNYTFAIQSPTSNQNVVVTFPPGPQPAPLNVSNFAASQAIITNQEFTLTWAAVVGGTATDFILVDVGLVGLSSPDYGTVGALTGQSTSFVIPAGTLGPNSTYDATLSFYRFNASTNVGSKLSTSAALVTRTLITLKTAGGSVQPVPPTLSNFQLTGGHFQFQVSASPGQTVIIDRATAPTGGSWQPFQTNTLSAAPLIVSDPVIAGETRFFRARSP